MSGVTRNSGGRTQRPTGRAPPPPEVVRTRASLVGRLRRVLDRLVPPACVACHAGLPPGSAPLCGVCRHRLPAVVPPWCGRCGATCPPGPAPCPECVEWPEELRRAVAPCRMEGVAARLVHALKYEGWTALSDPMGREMASVAPRVAPGGSDGRKPVLVPVPLSPARERERGFNQARLLARAVGTRTGWPVRELLVRERTGERQARLGRRARDRNVRGLFRTAAGATAAGPPILVDDVLTTGATAAACARALSRAGTGPAGIISFARASRVLGAP